MVMMRLTTICLQRVLGRPRVLELAWGGKGVGSGGDGTGQLVAKGQAEQEELCRWLSGPEMGMQPFKLTIGGDSG